MSLKDAKENMIKNVIAAVVGVIAQKSFIDPTTIQFEGKTLTYTKDVGILISALIELHDIFGLPFNEDLNKVEEKFSSIDVTIEYFMNRIIDEKITG